MSHQAVTTTIDEKAESFVEVKDRVNPNTTNQEGFATLKKASVEENKSKYPYSNEEVIVFDINCESDSDPVLVIPANSDSQKYIDLLKWAEVESIDKLCEREIPVEKYTDNIYTIPHYKTSELPTSQMKRLSKEKVDTMYNSGNWDFDIFGKVERDSMDTLIIGLFLSIVISLTTLTSINYIIFNIVLALLASLICSTLTILTPISNKLTSLYCEYILL